MLQAAQVSSVVAACLAPGEEAWLVGGAVRDGLLGRASKDLDFAVRGDAHRLARRVADLLGGAFFTFSEAFSTHRVVLPGGLVDFAPLRGATIERDLAARDFTVDAMALPARGGDPGARMGIGKVIDPLGGAADLAARRLVACGSRALADDPLRVLRLARLAAAFDLQPSEGLAEAARVAAPALKTVSGERVCAELTALLGLPAAARGLRLLDDCGALEQVLPEVTALRGVEQNRFHHLDVFGHTLEAVELVPHVVEQLGGQRFLAAPEACGLPGAASLAPLAFVALFHDLGKPGVRQMSDDGRVMFWHHDELGARMVKDIAARLKMSRRFQDYLGLLIGTHLRLGFLVREVPLTLRALVRFRRAVEPYVFESVVLSLADRLATRGEKTSAVSMARHYRLARVVWLEIPKQSREPLLDGDEAMGLLGLAPGPLLGEALRALQEETDALEVTTKDEARDFLLQWLARQAASAESEPTTAPGGREPTTAPAAQHPVEGRPPPGSDRA
jgi:poly(A) polymerase